MCGYCGFSGFENRNNRRNSCEIKMTCGGMAETSPPFPPQAPLPPCGVNKNGALIFREKTLRNGFLRTFENV